MKNIIALKLILGLLAILPTLVLAHAPHEHYTWIEVEDQRLLGQIELGVSELHELMGLELDPEVPLTEALLAPYSQKLKDYVEPRFAITADSGPLVITLQPARAHTEGDANSVMFDFVAENGQPIGKIVTVRDEMLYEFSTRHRGLLHITENRRTGASYGIRASLIFGPGNSEQELNLDDPPGLISKLAFVWQGMLHIFIGLDHILFLVTLLFTAVLIRKDQKWAPVDSFGQALWNVFKIVTLFTIAHSITLFLAGMGYLNLPGRWVESIIALSIIAVALNNLLGRFDAKKLWIILIFGLFHGLGFASVMSDLPFRMGDLIWVVIFFNIGVELGQIAIVAVVFPVLFALRKTAIYVPVVVVSGSLLIAAIASYWLVQRAFMLG